MAKRFYFFVFVYPFPIEFVYMINYTSNFDDKWTEILPFTDFSKQKQVSFPLRLPYAHTWYDVRVSMKVKDATNSADMWSNFSSYTFQTSQRIPDNPPLTDIGAFSYTDSGHVSIYWRALKQWEHNGKDLHYTVIETRNTTVKPKIIDQTMAKFEQFDANTMKDALNFLIYSENDVGRSKLSSTIRVPSAYQRCEQPTNIKKIRVNSTTYNLSWIAPSKGPKITSYTVFWCESPNESPSHCKGSVDFKRVDNDVLNFPFKTNETNTMNFAISANSNNTSSGMIWAMCTVLPGNEINKLTSIYMVKTQSTYIEFKWSLACIDRTILSGYTLEYCPIKDPKTDECKEPLKSYNISADAQEYKLDKLKPYTTYKTRIRMLSGSSKGPWSDALVNTTLEDAPTPPRFLKVYNITNSSATLTWDVPEFINGVLVEYLVSYNGNESRIKKDDATEHLLVLNNLESYKEYEVVVRACTVSCSVPSDKVKFKTAVGTPGTVSQPSIPKDNDNHLIWHPPKMPGGRLQYYELRVEGSHMPVRIIKINGTKCTLNLDFCNVQSGKFYFSVRAVNVLHSQHVQVDEQTHRLYDNDRGHLVKRDLAQKYIDIDSEQLKNSNFNSETSNLLKRHSKAEIDTIPKGLNANNKVDEIKKQFVKDHIDHGRSEMATGELGKMKLCREEDDLQLQSYLNSDQYAQPLPGKWSVEWSMQCNFYFHTGGFYFMLVFLIIFTMAFVYGSFFAMKKFKKMKDISVELPAGLEDIKEETKGKHLDGGINARDDIVHTLDYVHSNEQEQSLLRSRMESASSNSSENNSQCEYNEGIDNSTEYDQHTEDDSVQTVSENLDIEKVCLHFSHSSNISLKANYLFFILFCFSLVSANTITSSAY